MSLAPQFPLLVPYDKKQEIRVPVFSKENVLP